MASTASTWKKGHCGNPKGRPRKTEIERSAEELARGETQAAIATLVKALRARSCRDRITAAEAILDRGWGKAAQTTTLRVNASIMQYSDAELINIIAEASGGESGEGALVALPSPSEPEPVH